MNPPTSDYPHSEGVPTPRDFITEAGSGLTEQQMRQVRCEDRKRIISC